MFPPAGAQRVPDISGTPLVESVQCYGGTRREYESPCLQGASLGREGTNVYE